MSKNKLRIYKFNFVFHFNKIYFRVSLLKVVNICYYQTIMVKLKFN